MCRVDREARIAISARSRNSELTFLAIGVSR
jgi:hypothetical protein